MYVQIFSQTEASSAFENNMEQEAVIYSVISGTPEEYV